MFKNDKNDTYENLSSIYDGENLPDGELVQARSDASVKHMQNWSLIGSTLRDELPEKIDLNFTDDVFAKLELEENVGLTKLKLDLNEKQEQESKIRVIDIFKRVALISTEIAVAASFAVFTVIGWQTYTAGDIANSYDSSLARPSLGPVGDINLASYQNDKPNVINFNNGVSNDSSDAIKEQQQKEFNRINNYIKGYVLDPSKQ